MKISKYQKIQKEKRVKEALILYKQGLPLRKVGELVGRSYEWVRLKIKEDEKVIKV